jgi:hypothetical protein
MAEQSANAADQIVCHVTQCSETASYSCDHCGRAYCSTHIRLVSIQRRQSRAHTGSGLTRLPTYTETYWLCPSCWKKPVPGKHPQQIS